MHVYAYSIIILIYYFMINNNILLIYDKIIIHKIHYSKNLYISDIKI